MSDLETNKKNVVEFYDLLINKKDFKSAGKYMADHYIQHNPRAADGHDGLRAHIEHLKKDLPGVHSEIKKLSPKEIMLCFMSIHDGHLSGIWRSSKYSGWRTVRLLNTGT
jgi:predicted SnoaL-like aldol condensation-catalyzing enzyme